MIDSSNRPDARAGEAPRPRLGTIAWVLLLVGCGTVGTATLPTPKAKKPEAKKTLAPEAHGTKYAVATENGDASRIALEVLRKGGDAVDAAAAAAVALGVATPTACGVGGGGFAVVWRAKTKEAFVLDFRETAPAAVDVAALDARPLPPEKRGHMVGVPGEVQGLAQLVAKFGKRSFREDLQPAIDLARKGFTLTPHVARVSKMFGEPLQKLAPALGARLLAGSEPLPVGSKVVRPELADTLQAIADKGARVLYEGPLAEAFVEAVREASGTITLDDLAKYQTKIRPAIRVKIGGREVITMPPPSAGGVMLAQALRAHEVLTEKGGKGLASDPFMSGAYLHTVSELMRGALDDRFRFIGDPDHVPVDVAKLLEDARIEARLAKIDPWKTKTPVELRVDEHGTSHLSIVDAEGNAVALTTTVNGPFGAKIEVQGVIANDELGDFGKTADAIGNAPNVPRPGARPTSSMTPTIVLEGGQVRAIFGGSGGMRIGTSVTLAALAHLVFGVSPGDVVGLPRVHPAMGKLLVEDTLPPEVVADLEKRGENPTKAEVFNAVQMVAITRDEDGVKVIAASDPRKGGVALAE